MLMKRKIWFCVVAFIAVIGFSMISSIAFAEDSGKGTKEGIKVHGHWKIEIFNPDGSLANVVEFNNALFPTAPNALTEVLMGKRVIGGWQIHLDSTAGDPCDDGAGNPQLCFIGQSNADYSASAYTPNSLNLSISKGVANQLILSGSVTVTYDSTINIVSTHNSVCAYAGGAFSATVSPQQCLTSSTMGSGITTTTLGSPPSVVSGQLIQVTVEISFS
jgi:hypothetical protein